MVAESAGAYEVLIVDDDAAFRETLRAVFEPYFILMEAECGEEALELLGGHRFHLALFDMHMRELTGLDVIRHLRSTLITLPCILITASLTDEIQKEAEQVETYSVLRKPVARQELITTVAVALQETYQDPDLPQRLGM